MPINKLLLHINVPKTRVPKKFQDDTVVYYMFQKVMVSPMLFPDSKIELKLEKREPLKGRAKTPVTLKQRRVEHNQVS